MEDFFVIVYQTQGNILQILYITQKIVFKKQMFEIKGFSNVKAKH